MSLVCVAEVVRDVPKAASVLGLPESPGGRVGLFVGEARFHRRPTHEECL